jgi:hypothetical protein
VRLNLLFSPFLVHSKLPLFLGHTHQTLGRKSLLLAFANNQNCRQATLLRQTLPDGSYAISTLVLAKSLVETGVAAQTPSSMTR